MIVNALINILIGLLNFILYPLLQQPDAVLSDGFTSSMVSLMSFVAILKPVLPLVVFFLGLSTVVLVEVAVAFYKGIMWVIKKIPGIN